MANSSDHQSRRATEQLQYHKLRQQGVTTEHARRISLKGSEQAHRSIDRNTNKK